jgi:probable phosphoglycerate mutase
MAADPHFSAPGGESAAAFAMRLAASFRTIAGQHPGQTALIVSHGGAIATALAMLAVGDGGRWLEFQMANCGLSEIIWGERPQVLCLNDTTHLNGAAKPQSWGAE